MALTFDQVKKELAILYFLNVFGVLFIPATFVSLALFFRLKSKTKDDLGLAFSKLKKEERVASALMSTHLAWLKSCYTLFFTGFAVSLFIHFGLGRIQEGPFLLMMASFIFFGMIFYGYLRLLLGKAMGLEDRYNA